MAIRDRNLTPASVLVGSYKKERYECRVEVLEGKVSFLLNDGRRFKSPSAAAGAVMGGKAVNGWLFWTLSEDDISSPPPQRPQARSGKLIRRLPNQQGIEAGKARYWCNGCMKSFIAGAAQIPSKCPAGHDGTSENA